MTIVADDPICERFVRILLDDVRGLREKVAQYRGALRLAERRARQAEAERDILLPAIEAIDSDTPWARPGTIAHDALIQLSVLELADRVEALR
jgi:hypothetical protein